MKIVSAEYLSFVQAAIENTFRCLYQGYTNKGFSKIKSRDNHKCIFIIYSSIF